MRQLDTIIENLNGIEKIIDKTLKELCLSYAIDMEHYAKTHKAWKTRTGQAEQGLVGEANFEDGGYHAMICQNMFGTTGEEYGYYLEYAERFHGKYAILRQTRDHFAKTFFDDAEDDLKEAIAEAKLERN